MSHITTSPPSSLPSQASGPDSGAHNSLLSLSASEREALFLPSPMSSKTVMNAMQWPRKWTLEKEREKKKQSCVCGGALSLYSPPLVLSPPGLVCAFMCVCLCVCTCHYVCLQGPMCLSAFMWICMSVHTRPWLWVWVGVRAYICVCLSRWVSWSLHQEGMGTGWQAGPLWG